VGGLGRLGEVEGSCEAIFGQRVMSSMRYGDDDDDDRRVECFRYVVLGYLYNAEFSSDFHSKLWTSYECGANRQRLFWIG